MKRLGDKGTNAVTLLHKLVGLAWLVAAVATLVLTVPARASGRVAWDQVTLWGRVGSSASVVTIVLAFAYGIFTVWGFLGSRWLLAKWGLYLAAVSASGYTIRATREQVVATVAILAAVQLVALVACLGIGVYLERARHQGKLPHARTKS
jgi:hypothetical protein